MAMPIALMTAGREPSEAGLLAALGALVIMAAQPLLRHRDDPDRRMVGGYLLLGAGLAVAGVFPTLPATRSTTVIALGDVLLLGYTYTLVARLAPAGAKAAYFSVYGITWGIALTVGPPLMGAALAYGPCTFWLVAAGAMLVTGAAHRLAAQGSHRA